ncbi:hypothetical protein ASE64_11665 [Agreia sp. Leaf210]|nr:hypothetical protein ASE64_11665 [Agreia sp. Leaf210]
MCGGECPALDKLPVDRRPLTVLVERLPGVYHCAHVDYPTLVHPGLVIIIWGLAGPALSQVFEQAIDRVTAF